MKALIKIGTRESDLALWQAHSVRDLLSDLGHETEIIPITSDGDEDQVTPLYEMGVQGIFTKSLDIALLNKRIDIAVHSMKDVPTVLPSGISRAAVLKRGNYKDLFVVNDFGVTPLIKDNKEEREFLRSLVSDKVIHLEDVTDTAFLIATSSVRRKAQWLHRYPKHQVVNLRGNINTRMKKIAESNWAGAILAAAGLERIGLKPASSIELNWMLPAPAQGAIMVTARTGDTEILHTTRKINDELTEVCTSIEKDFLRALMGGCSTPIAALALPDKKEIYFKGNILSLDGREKIEIEKFVAINEVAGFGLRMAHELLNNGGKEIADKINGK